MHTRLTLDFGPGRYDFWLPMARIVEIERECGNKSILAMHDEMGHAMGIERETERQVFLGGGNGRIKDIYEVIRCAAIGGGTSPIDAKRLADEYVDGRPLSETLPVAWAILDAAIRGVQLKKKAEAPEDESLSPSTSA